MYPQNVFWVYARMRKTISFNNIAESFSVLFINKLVFGIDNGIRNPVFDPIRVQGCLKGSEDKQRNIFYVIRNSTEIILQLYTVQIMIIQVTFSVRQA